MLESRELKVYFDGIRAVDGVDISLAEGEIVGLIGPNGAGKTTLVNALSGFQRPTGGRVFMDGRDVTSETPQTLVKYGLVRTFQAIRLFSGLSVRENVELGVLSAGRSHLVSPSLVSDLLELLNLTARADAGAGSLPHGDARRLGLARALATHPRFILLDEPAAGLDESERDDLIRTIALIPERFSCGVLLIEHDMGVIMRTCERIHVLDYGKTISVGTPDEVRLDPAVVEAYLGNGGQDDARS